MRQLGLSHHCIHDTFHARCEEPRHPVSSKFQLSEADIVVSIVIACRTEFNVLWVIGVSEADFCGRVEATDDVVQIIDEFGIREEDWRNKAGTRGVISVERTQGQSNL
jgi:hypothetical protein